jgi:hypothetical protein
MGDSEARATKHTPLPTKALGLAAALIIKKEETKGIVVEETKQHKTSNDNSKKRPSAFFSMHTTKETLMVDTLFDLLVRTPK